MKKLLRKIAKRFADFEYRHSYVETFVDTQLSAQIQVLREQREKTQAQLAELAEMKQSQISRFENADNCAWQIRTLKKLARAFDLVLVIKFESFGNVLPNVDAFSREALKRYSFDDDPAFLSPEYRPSADASIITSATVDSQVSDSTSFGKDVPLVA